MFKAKQDFYIGEEKVLEGTLVKEEKVTARMKELQLVEFIQEDKTEKPKKVKKEPKVKKDEVKDELLIEDSSNVEVTIEASEDTKEE